MRYQQDLISAIFTKKETSMTKPNVSIDSAISVYHNNYIENGIRAMSICFATVYGLMDEQDFRKLAKEYLTLYPKTCFDWADYGEYFADFMFEVNAISQMPFLPELAALDWRLMHIERCNNKHFNVESFNRLQSSSLEHIKFDPAPGLQIMKVLFPVVEIHQLVHKYSDENIQRIAKNSQYDSVIEDKKRHLKNVKKLINDAINSPQYRSIVLWREEYKALFEYCTSTSELAISSMLENNSIASVLSHFGADQTNMAHWLQNQIESRKINAIIDL